MLHRLAIALVQVKVGSISASILNEICQLIWSLYQEKEITKIVYNNIMTAKRYKTEWILLINSPSNNLKIKTKYLKYILQKLYYFMHWLWDKIW